jgi:hypothetical protein
MAIHLLQMALMHPAGLEVDFLPELWVALQHKTGSPREEFSSKTELISRLMYR